MKKLSVTKIEAADRVNLLNTGRVTPNMLCLSKTEIMNQSPGRAEGSPENFPEITGKIPGIPVIFTGNFIPGDFIISVVNFVI